MKSEVVYTIRTVAIYMICVYVCTYIVLHTYVVNPLVSMITIQYPDIVQSNCDISIQIYFCPDMLQNVYNF